MASSEYGYPGADVHDINTVSKDTARGFARADRMGNLEQVVGRIKNCEDRSLSQGRVNAVPG